MTQKSVAQLYWTLEQGTAPETGSQQLRVREMNVSNYWVYLKGNMSNVELRLGLAILVLSIKTTLNLKIKLQTESTEENTENIKRTLFHQDLITPRSLF